MHLLKNIFVLYFLVATNNVAGQSKLDSVVLDYINKYRGEHFLLPLKWSPLLYCMAESKALYCKEKKHDIYNHDGMYANDIEKKEAIEAVFNNCQINEFNKNWFLIESITPYINDVNSFSYRTDIIANAILEEMKNNLYYNSYLLSNTLEYAAVGHAIGNELKYYLFFIENFQEINIDVSGTIYFIVFEATGKSKNY
jgi:hypothetical protein